jgi:hypothetical protein
VTDAEAVFKKPVGDIDLLVIEPEAVAVSQCRLVFQNMPHP